MKKLLIGMVLLVLSGSRAGAAETALVASPHSKNQPGESLAEARTRKMNWTDPSSIRPALDKAIATGNPKEWEPLIESLTNPNYRNDICRAMLSDLLKVQDWSVRIRAAEDLYELGSNSGITTLQEALQVEAVDSQIPDIMILTAAITLQRAGVTTDPVILEALYRKTKSRELVEIAAAEGDPWVEQVVQEKRARNDFLFETELLAAYLRLNDPVSIKRYELLISAGGERRVLGNWAMFRATGSAEYLEHVIQAAQGTDEPAPNSSLSRDAQGTAIRLLAMTASSGLTKRLETFMDHEAGKENPSGFNSTGALFILYFTQKDYAFIDQRVSDYFHGNYPATLSMRSLFWEIASVRRTPEIERMAFAMNPESYDLYFVRMAGRPLHGPVILKR